MELIIAIVSICIFIALLSFSILKIWLPGYMVREMEQYQNKLLERQFEEIDTEFLPTDRFSYIRNAVDDVLSTGCVPIVAHVERYVCTVKNWDYIYELKQLGADIQVNASSVTGDNGWSVQRCVKALLKDHVVDYIASDAHDTTSRTPQLSKCYKYIVKKYGVEYADRIMKADVVEKFG